MNRSIYLTDEEEEAAAELARRYGASFSYIVRTAIRVLAGLPVPAQFKPPDATHD